MKRNYTILCIEDDDADFLLIQRQLKNSKLGATLDRVETEAELRAFVASHDVDLILSDNNLPGFSGIQALEIMQQIEPDIPFIIVSGTIGEELAVSAMRSGASDYILKDNLKRLLPAVEREISDFQLRKKERLNRKQLILTELRYKFLAESIKEVFFALDHKLRFTYWNDTASKIFRKTDIIGKNVNDVFPEWQDSQILAVLSESLVNGIEKPLRFTHRVRGTEYFKGKVYPSTEGVSVLLSNVTDETHGRKKLEIVNNELATLFYRISHDLKGPVASVLGLLNIATKDELMSKEQLTGMIKANVDRLNAILSELLDITNIKTGETKLSTLEIASCIESIIESLKHQAGFEEMKFRINISKDLLFRSDKILFKSIWQNLIENSIK
ncbi:MAG: response regulator, partial [Bacteroidota bacterium]